MKRALGAALIALPIGAGLAVYVLAWGWAIVALMVAVIAVGVACVLGGVALLMPDSPDVHDVFGGDDDRS